MERYQEKQLPSLMVDSSLLVFPRRPQQPIPSHSNASFIKGQWTPEEDQLLVRLVEQYGVKRWSHIARMLVGRLGKQCRERWHNHLRPDIKKDTWSEEEDMALVAAHTEIGNKWAEIAKRIPGRTENSIKNHWNATKRRQLSKKRCRRREAGHRRSSSVLLDYMRSMSIILTEQGKEANRNCTESTSSTSLETGDLNFDAGSDNSQSLLFDDEDLSFLFWWSTTNTTATANTTILSSIEENSSFSIETGGFTYEYEQVKRELDLIELVSFNVNISGCN